VIGVRHLEIGNTRWRCVFQYI